MSQRCLLSCSSRSGPVRLLLLASLLAGPLAGLHAQTVGVSGLNDAFLDIGARGATRGPPNGLPCGTPPPALIPTNTDYAYSISVTRGGLPVLVYGIFRLGCAPGLVPPPFCHPAVGGIYAGIPPVVGPCLNVTNQSIDLILVGGGAAQLFTTGMTGPMAGGAFYTTGRLRNVQSFGTFISLQAAIIDPAAGPQGYVLTNVVEATLL